MSNLSRRGFIALGLSATLARTAPGLIRTVQSPPAKRVLTLVYDKSIGAMRAIDRVVP